MKLVEECAGEGRLTVRGEAAGPVGYSLSRYQAMTRGGLPVPGLHRIEGRLELEGLTDALGLAADMHLALELEDGRRLDLTLIDLAGRVLGEGHGPGKCGCC